MQKPQKQSKAQTKPTSNNGQFRSLWEMDENEKLLQEQHQQQLKQKYRDRAKERRQGVSDLKHDGLIGGSSDSESDDEDKYVKIQGLDYEKLEQVRKEIADTEEQKEKNKQT
ncbi:hypothetical protein PPERSA_03753 [Pseudocohnilembus persalinus]|uniref:RED-like N-terminal domain-containing protein n=1 Tax=Pseudocohnilembus persalinus TaxID=266149 RepID=A0A0V0QBN9_PSEPJ|nr:hypothetical protein PPERSA_03753 [Pseudocohnilembus persalinus]|eukprot:KRW99578.1 hypothetical protein PPERSA_03753 [Pseudocohnilembus persalinus]